MKNLICRARAIFFSFFSPFQKQTQVYFIPLNICRDNRGKSYLNYTYTHALSLFNTYTHSHFICLTLPSKSSNWIFSGSIIWWRTRNVEVAVLEQSFQSDGLQSKPCGNRGWVRETFSLTRDLLCRINLVAASHYGNEI